MRLTHLPQQIDWLLSVYASVFGADFAIIVDRRCGTVCMAT